jgi:hypothetical protein
MSKATEAADQGGTAFLQRQPFAIALPSVCERSDLGPDYRDALAAYAAWRSTANSLAERYAALCYACHRLEALCSHAPTFPRLSTFARAAWDAGMRGKSVQALEQLIAMANRATISIAEPFWPACPRYETVDPGKDIGVWLVAAAIEQFERSSSFSSQFGPLSPLVVSMMILPDCR